MELSVTKLKAAPQVMQKVETGKLSSSAAERIRAKVERILRK